jgi:hypothetical protein
MAFYRKNIGGAQQFVRLAVGLAGAAAVFAWLQGTLAYLGIAAGLVFAATGFVGYCPMCAMADIGRRERT